MTVRHRLVVAPRAESDLRDIYRHTAQSFDPAQAEKYLARMEKAFLDLLRHPEIGRERPDIKPGYRCLPVEKHLVFYVIRKREIHILGVPHMRMDVQNYFTGKSKRP
jgi:toxin ParE1/3/4